MRTTIVALVLVATTSPALALDQSVHETISHDSCVNAGLPDEFCERVGTEAYNTDSYEWNSPEAHAQIGKGALADTCTAANAALERERALGSDIRTSLVNLAHMPSENLRIHIATQLGRALHTIQDNCAHHGMPNAQHAWWSRTDACTGSATSPDVQSDAMSCAWTETAAVLAAFTEQMGATGIGADQLDNLSEGWTHWPKRADVCKFLHEAEVWAGGDRRWDNSIMVPALRTQLTNAITTDDSAVFDACSTDISAPNPDWNVDVSTPPAFCLKLKTYCALTGKDDAADAPPPWEDSAADSPAGGCAAATDGSSGPGGMIVALLGLAFAVRRRRG